MPEALQEATGEPQTAENAPSGTQTPPEQDNGSESQPETFNREYVEKLRKEAAEHRVKSKRADQLASALVTSYADTTGRLHDPSDLPFSDELLDEDGLPDRQKVAHAVEALVTAKPHLAKIRVVGDVGQGVQGQQEVMPSLAGMLRRAAG